MVENKKEIFVDEYEKLAVYYNYFDVSNKYGITFERFVNLVKNNLWEQYVN